MFQELLQQIKEGEFDFPAYIGGWIHPDGTVEQFDEYSPEIHFEDAFKKLYNKKYNGTGEEGERASNEYIEKGNIRFVAEPNALNIEFIKRPTNPQMASIGKLAKQYSYFYADSYGNSVMKFSTSSWTEFRDAVNNM